MYTAHAYCTFENLNLNVLVMHVCWMLQKELEEAHKYLGHMGMTVHKQVGIDDIQLTDKEILDYKAAFKHFDVDNSGSISLSNLRSVLHEGGEKITDDQLRQLFNEVHTKNKNNIDLDEFLQVRA